MRMKRTRIKSIICLSWLICLLFGLSAPVFAEENQNDNAVLIEAIQNKRHGTMNVHIHTKSGADVGGGQITIFHVGDINVDEDNNAGFVYTDRFNGCPVPLTNTESHEVANAILKYATDHGIKGTVINVPSDGELEFNDVPMGLYLIEQNQRADGYKKMPPFLISMPEAVYKIENNEKVFDQYKWDVDCWPKTDPEPIKDEDEPDHPGDKDKPNTGTETHLYQWMGILAVSGCLALVVRDYLKKA